MTGADILAKTGELLALGGRARDLDHVAAAALDGTNPATVATILEGWLK